MSQTFFFYDLETSGLSARDARVMQFAGIRTDMNLNPVCEPMNILVALNDDTLPSPEALLVTGITPQQTVADGYTEAQFAQDRQELEAHGGEWHAVEEEADGRVQPASSRSSE